ncbi:uncharacterized protein LOC110909670 [Helianthus annuus]|uniref:uncharacterized protein LOC110909670 n=1 Tax=Helianthus annuus TaxID=4232 RepID=UPI000B8FE272|nr:uncharacterized protein LOC110909670 [Helianthus annuus]
MLNKETPFLSLQAMKNKEARFYIQVTKDTRNRTLRCIVNRATYLKEQTETTIHGSNTPTSTTPQPPTPAPRNQTTTSAKRPILQSEGDKNNTHKRNKDHISIN